MDFEEYKKTIKGNLKRKLLLNFTILEQFLFQR